MSDAKKPDIQAGYESMLTFLAYEQNGVDVVLQGAGCLDSYLSMSFEKMVADFQIADYVDTYLKDIIVDDETVPIEDMEEAGPSGSFLTADSTIENFRTAVLDPIISVRGPKPINTLESNTESYIKKALEKYKAPEIDRTQIEDMKKIALNYGIKKDLINKIEHARE